MSGRNFSLTDRLSAFVDALVEAGRHQRASEVVCEAPRRHEDVVLSEQASLAAIERVAENGIAAIEGGEFTVVSGRDGSRALLERLHERARSRRAAGVRQRG